MKRVRVLFLVAHLHKGGMQRALSNISTALGTEMEQFVGYFGTENPGFEYCAEHVHFQIPGGRSGVARKVWNFVARMKALRKFVVERNIDVVVSFGEAANVLNLVSVHGARRIISVRVSLSESLGELGRYGSLYATLARLLYRRADTIVPVSQGIARQLQKDHRVDARRVEVIPNLYPVGSIRELAAIPLPPEWQSVFEKPVILNVGSLCHQKGQDLLLEAFARIGDEVPDAALVLIGRGDLKSHLQHRAKGLGLESRVHFIDFDPNPYRYMRRAQLFVLSSRYEGFPNVLVEAVIAGCPVVSFDCPTGPAEILSEGEGMLVPGESVDGLAGAMVAMLGTDRTQWTGDRVAREYSHERLSGRWRTLIEPKSGHG